MFQKYILKAYTFLSYLVLATVVNKVNISCQKTCEITILCKNIRHPDRNYAKKNEK